jgi:putative sigma-54 modulation protein
MELSFRGRNLRVTKALKDYVRGKMAKIERHLNDIIRGEIELVYETNPSISDNHRAEITLYTKGPLIRAVASSSNMYASIDLTIDKLEKQIDKYKGKIYSSRNRHREKFPETLKQKRRNKKAPSVVKRKQFVVKPMSLEEAILQMELLQHDFFIFANADTETLNVLYRRKDNTYGLIEAIPG